MAAELEKDGLDRPEQIHPVCKTKLSTRFCKLIIMLLAISMICITFDYFYFKRNCDCEISIEEKIKRFRSLKSEMNKEVFGQHIAVDGILNALYAHTTDPNPKKALVLSFHGWLGSGKTFVSQLIAKTFFIDGLESQYVKSFIGPRHFLLDSTKLKSNQDLLAKIVEETIKLCDRSLFIFDEVDKMPSEILDVLVPFLDHHGIIDGKNYRKAIYIFLSNTGGKKINNIAGEHISSGEKRETLSLLDFHEAGTDGAFTEKGGLFKAHMITQRLVDHFIPFLPLEREHIILCAKREMKRRNVLYIDPEKIADRVSFGQRYSGVNFAQDGCKNIMTHVGFFVHYSDSMFDDEL